MSGPQNSDDYIWHFKLKPGELAAGGDEALVEMVRAQIVALLRCVELTSGGQSVSVSGFRFLGDPDQEHRLSSALAGPDGGENKQREDDEGVPRT